MRPVETRERASAGIPPLVSVIVPCRNEERFLATCLDSMIANDYPVDRLEVLVVDGMSEDGSREIASEYARKYPHIKLVDNPRRITPAAFNTGIRSAMGEIIMIVGAHAHIQRDYITQSVRALQETGGDNVGGVMKAVPQNNTLVGRAIASSLSHPFGVGNAHFRTHRGGMREVDTVYGGCYRRDIFSRIGLFNEELVRSQDMEFNLRLRLAGGKIMLLPSIVSYYHARSSLWSFLRHNLSNGFWAIVPFLHSQIFPVSWRHLVPLAFVGALLGLVGAAFAWPPFILPLEVLAGLYVAGALCASASIAVRERDPMAFFALPLIFLSLHLSYGFGALAGTARVAYELGARSWTRFGEVRGAAVQIDVDTDGSATPARYEQVSVVIPCRNEVKYIASCLDSLLASDYPKDKLEFVVVDGMSEDGTRGVVEEYAKRHSFIRMLDNARRITPCALNVGIRGAAGDILIRVDAHAHCPPDYIGRCVAALQRYGVDNVGGNMVTVPREGTVMGRAITAALSHPFGVGNSHFRIQAREPRWVDTVFGGCYRKALFDRIGLFNEDLVFSQDLEFNLRLKRAGGKILLLPSIVSYYSARSDLSSFWKHNIRNGQWVILPVLHSTTMPVAWRHLVPMGFVLVLAASLGTMFLWPGGPLLVGGIAVAYLLAALVASIQIAIRERDIRFLIVMPFVFLVLHMGYGVGSLAAMARLPAELAVRRPRKV